MTGFKPMRGGLCHSAQHSYHLTNEQGHNGCHIWCCSIPSMMYKKVVSTCTAKFSTSGRLCYTYIFCGSVAAFSTNVYERVRWGQITRASLCCWTCCCETTSHLTYTIRQTSWSQSQPFRKVPQIMSGHASCFTSVSIISQMCPVTQWHSAYHSAYFFFAYNICSLSRVQNFRCMMSLKMFSSCNPFRYAATLVVQPRCVYFINLC